LHFPNEDHANEAGLSKEMT